MASTSALLISLLALLTFAHVAHGCGINVLNSCPYGVTTCAQSGGINPVYEYQLGSGAEQYLDFGSACEWPQGAVWASVTGQCANPVGSGDPTDRNLANLAELNIGGGTDYYDLSNVNAYTIGLSIAVISSAGGQCTTISCVISNIRSFCQGDNQLISLSSGALTCINTDGTAGEGPTSNTELFKAACPDAFSYNNDPELFTCNTGSDYEVTFCPGGITLPMNQSNLDMDH